MKGIVLLVCLPASLFTIVSLLIFGFEDDGFEEEGDDPLCNLLLEFLSDRDIHSWNFFFEALRRSY